MIGDSGAQRALGRLVAATAQPLGVATSPDGATLYVTNAAVTSNSVSGIDSARGQVVRTIPVGSNSLEMADFELMRGLIFAR